MREPKPPMWIGIDLGAKDGDCLVKTVVKRDAATGGFTVVSVHTIERTKTAAANQGHGGSDGIGCGEG